MPALLHLHDMDGSAQAESHAEQGARGHQQALDKTAALITFSKVAPNIELERLSKWNLPFWNSEHRGGQRADAQRIKGNKPSAPPRPLQCPRVIAMLLSDHSSLFPSAPICWSWVGPKDTEMAQNPVERPDVGDRNTLHLTAIPSSEKGKQPWLGRSWLVLRPSSHTPWFYLQILPPRWTWAGYITSLSLHIFICKMGVITVVLLPHSVK